MLIKHLLVGILKRLKEQRTMCCGYMIWWTKIKLIFKKKFSLELTLTIKRRIPKQEQCEKYNAIGKGGGVEACFFPNKIIHHIDVRIKGRVALFVHFSEIAGFKHI